MGIHVSEPGRPLGTRLPDAFRARRVADRGEPEAIRPSTRNTDRPVDPTRFDTDTPARNRRAVAEYQEDAQYNSATEKPYLPAKQLASRRVVTMEASGSLLQAFQKMEEYGIHHLVITSQAQTAGLVDKQWVLWNLWRGETGGSARTLETMELPAFITVTPETDAHDLARQMLGYQLGAALVMDADNRPSGVVTGTDFLRLYADSRPYHTTI